MSYSTDTIESWRGLSVLERHLFTSRPTFVPRSERA